MRIKRVTPWMFGVVAIPYGVVSALVTTVMPFVFRGAGLSIESIGWFSIIAQIPSYTQFLYAPLVDLKFNREIWLIGASFVSAACILIATFLPLPQYAPLFLLLILLANISVTFISACNGGVLAATPMSISEKSKASAWHSFGNLGGLSIASFVFLSLTEKISPYWVSILGVALTVLPALFVLLLPRPQKTQEQRGRESLHALFKALRSRLGWSGILLCLSPVGTAALMYSFSGVAKDYQLSDRYTIGLFLGLGSAVALAIGSYIAGTLNHRFSPRKVYLTAGLISATISIIMALAPLRPTTFLIGVSCYFLVAGLATASFYAVVFETIGQAGGAFSTYYTLFISASNAAIAYVSFINTRYAEHGTRGLLVSDAVLNIAGAIIWGILLTTLFSKKRLSLKKEQEIA